jgi:hypothetical protein
MPGIRSSAIIVLMCTLPGRALGVESWLAPTNPRVRLIAGPEGSWQVTSLEGDEFTLDSAQRFDARTGDTFAVSVRIRVGIDTKALPELVSYDERGVEIAGRPALANAPDNFSTNWQHYHRVFAAAPGAASVRARIRGSGRAAIELAQLESHPVQVNSYETGMLVDPTYASLRKGVVLESNFGILNEDRVSTADRDGDGRWALIVVDLDRLTEPPRRGEDWRSRFEYNPGAIFWSDGAVLKSDTVPEDSPPDRSRALHYRARVRPGPYRVRVSDPGRAVSLSLDGANWMRHEGGREIDLGVRDLKEGVVEFRLDACHRDHVSVGPVYFDYVRLSPAPDPAFVETLVRRARQEPVSPLRGSVDEKAVAITVRSPRYAEAASWPVRCGLPIPRGELADPARVAVENAAGERTVCQARTQAMWPDGSVKWLALDFRHPFADQSEGGYRVVYGNSVRPLAGPERVRIEPTADGLEVDTGAIRFRVPRLRFGMVEDVRLPGGEPVQSAPIAAEIVESGGRRWRALEQPVERLEVEQAGPLHAVILAATALPSSGRPSSGFAHRARIHAYAGSPLVQVDYFIANTDSRPARGVEGSMASKVAVRSLSLMIRPDRPVARVLTELGPEGAAGALVQKTEDVAIHEGREQPRRLRGWLSAALEGGGALALGVENFREQFPKAVRWGPEGISIDLWAEEGGDFDWIEGVGKTHHLSLYYGKRASDAALLAEGRVLATADPAWYCSSAAFGPIGTAAESPLPAVERTLARHIDESMLGKVGLGFENHGDHSSGGYVKGTFLWDNNEYDVPAACLVHFARTGDTAALRLGLSSALHYLDVDTIHYSSRHADWAGAQHVHSHATFGHHTAAGPNMHHAGYVQGLILYSYLTGEPIGLEGAQGIAEWVLTHLGDHTVGMERQLGHPLMTLGDLYEATWDERWLRGAAVLVDQALRWEYPVRSGFLAPITESPAFYSGSPFCGGLLTAGLLKFDGWAHLPDLDPLLERVAVWTLTDVWEPPAVIQNKGGSPRMGRDPQNISSHLRLMARVFERTDDPVFLAVPRRSILEGFGRDDRSFGTRETGLVFNYLPWFLRTLSASGNPQDDPELELKPAQAQLSLSTTRGQECTVTFVVANRGTTPIEDLAVSCRGRLDFEVVAPEALPRRLEPGATAALTYRVRAPEPLNLTCRANRSAPIHCAALYRRGGRRHVASNWIEVVVQDAPAR